MNHISVHPTPNPNSLKFVLASGTFITGGLESFGSAAEADGHDLSVALFAVEGVVNVFIVPQFLTVTKESSESWDDMTDQILEILARHLPRDAS